MSRLTPRDMPVNAGAVFHSFSSPAEGSYPCLDRCGTVLSYPGVCQDCYERAEGVGRRELLTTARKSIPALWRWARWDAPEMPSRVLGGNTALVQRMLPVIAEKARRLLAEHGLVVFWGDSGVGKTSFATALLQELIDAGERQGVDRRNLDRAARSRFLDAGAIADLENISREIGDKKDVEDKEFFERRASVLVVDNLGFELNGCPPNTPLGAMRAQLSKKIVSTRISEGRDLIVTMWMTQQEASRAYGGGFARLLFEVNSCAIELKRMNGERR